MKGITKIYFENQLKFHNPTGRDLFNLKVKVQVSNVIFLQSLPSNINKFKPEISKEGQMERMSPEISSNDHS